MSELTDLQQIIADALGDSNNGNLSKFVAEAVLAAGYSKQADE